MLIGMIYCKVSMYSDMLKGEIERHLLYSLIIIINK